MLYPSSTNKKRIALWQYIAVIIVIAAVAFSIYKFSKIPPAEQESVLKKRYTTVR